VDGGARRSSNQLSLYEVVFAKSGHEILAYAAMGARGISIVSSLLAVKGNMLENEQEQVAAPGTEAMIIVCMLYESGFLSLSESSYPQKYERRKKDKDKEIQQTMGQPIHSQRIAHIASKKGGHDTEEENKKQVITGITVEGE
jgi:hypothetical protein